MLSENIKYSALHIGKVVFESLTSERSGSAQQGQLDRMKRVKHMKVISALRNSKPGNEHRKAIEIPDLTRL